MKSADDLNRQQSWFQTALSLRGSVIPAVMPRTIVCGAFGAIVTVFYQREGVAMPPSSLASIIPNVVLGLMLVFRTNTAYERFWEGRKLWGSMVNTVRNLAREIWVMIQETTPADRPQKIAALDLLVAFAVATKLYLRQEKVLTELEPLLSRSQYLRLKQMNHPPLEIAFWLQDYLQQQYLRHCLNVYQLVSLQKLLNTLVDNLGGCERILKTPIPLAYAIHLKQLLLIYCLLLPFQFVADLGWWTSPIVALVSFTLFGIEEIGIEIENPFGHDANDIPLDVICATMKRNIDDLTTLQPGCTLVELRSADTLTGNGLAGHGPDGNGLDGNGLADHGLDNPTESSTGRSPLEER